MLFSIFSKSSAPTKNLRYSVPKAISLPRTRPQHCFVIASCGASCGRGSQLLFFNTQSSCRWHWMPVNLQLVRVLFSSRCEQSFWQRREDIFSSWFSRSIASPKGEWPTRRLVCQWWDFVQLCNLAAQLTSHQNATCRGDRAGLALHVTSSEALCA